VFINSAGKLGTATSSRRFKEEIKPMNDASEALFSLHPYADSRKRRADVINMLDMWVCFFSLVAFGVGCYFAYVAIQGIAASQPHWAD